MSQYVASISKGKQFSFLLNSAFCYNSSKLINSWAADLGSGKGPATLLQLEAAANLPIPL
jgi:hypothetical protein